MIENNSCEEIIMGSFQYNLNAWKPLCAKECPELTSDVPRVEENHKNHTQELFLPSCSGREKSYLYRSVLGTRISKDTWRERERQRTAKRAVVQESNMS